jgi:hypothetical protein
VHSLNRVDRSVADAAYIGCPKNDTLASLKAVLAAATAVYPGVDDFIEP